MRDQALRKAISLAGGPAALGQVLGIKSQAISQWQRCPAERVIAVEKATGGEVSRHELRPDLYPEENAQSKEDVETHQAGEAA